MFHSSRVLETVDPRTNIEYHRYHGVGPVWGRDFCVLSHWCRMAGPSGEAVFVLAARSVEHDRCPEGAPSTKLVRGWIRTGGFVLRALGDGSRTEVTFIANTDLRGEIPMWIQKVGRGACTCIHVATHTHRSLVPSSHSSSTSWASGWRRLQHTNATPAD
jgi:hypothetical protein